MSTSVLSQHLPLEDLAGVLQPGGVLSRVLKGFEAREPQQKMLSNVVRAYNDGTISLIEAGTGTGKSVAYLLPAMLWSLRFKERTVVSTNTIALQEQLINKDIPLLTKALGISVKAVLVKGMGNYVCLRKLQEAVEGINLLGVKEAEELQVIEAWKEKTNDGSRSDLPFVPSYATWEQVCAESDTCNYNKCPYYKDCYFFKAREEAATAQILVANHNLLFTDLATRCADNNYDEAAILPAYKRIVIDEAHHIEDIATEHFAARTSRLTMIRLLARLSSDRQGQQGQVGKLSLLKKKLIEFYSKSVPPQLQDVTHRLNVELPGLRQDLINFINNTFQTLEIFLASLAAKAQSEGAAEGGIDEHKLRILPAHLEHDMWKIEVRDQVKQLTDAISRYSVALKGLDTAIEAINDAKLLEQTRGVRFDILALAGRLEEASLTLQNFTSLEPRPANVRWIESHHRKQMVNTHVITADLDVSERLVKALFAPFPTVVMCSATLTTNQQFSYIRQRLGLREETLPDREIDEHIYESPFDYKQQAMLAVPSDAPVPTDRHFLASAVENIFQAIQASRGNAFVLFTSYSMLQLVHRQLADRLKENRYTVFKHGDESRQILLDKFKTTDRSVLFGTDSFWEGVDVVGEALRCVIIVKLPFRVPSEPIVEARSEAIVARGGEPFMEYAVPQAIVKFKQGFGRLIRNKKDRGCIVCLDPRLITKRYGKLFLNSLPECQHLFTESKNLHSEMEAFYKRTYRLTK